MDRKQKQKLYKSKRWQALRARQLRLHPYCQCPHCEGKKIPADTVDHKEPHRGDVKKFWQGPFQSMTRFCHSKFKQSEETGGRGFDQGCDEDGNPINKDARWYDGEP